MLSWWFAFILQWFPSGAFLESFSHAHTFWYCCDSVMELSQAHGLPYHHFNGVHVRSLIHPHWVILESSGWTRCTSCYTEVYFLQLPTWRDTSVAILGHISLFLFWRWDYRLLTELLSFSLFNWGIFIHITDHSIDDLRRDEPSEEPDLWVLSVSLPMTL